MSVVSGGGGKSVGLFCSLLELHGCWERLTLCTISDLAAIVRIVHLCTGENFL